MSTIEYKGLCQVEVKKNSGVLIVYVCSTAQIVFGANCYNCVRASYNNNNNARASCNNNNNVRASYNNNNYARASYNNNKNARASYNNNNNARALIKTDLITTCKRASFVKSIGRVRDQYCKCEQRQI